MTWEMFFQGAGSGLISILVTFILTGEKAIVWVMIAWIIACAIFGIAGMTTHTIGSIPVEITK